MRLHILGNTSGAFLPHHAAWHAEMLRGLLAGRQMLVAALSRARAYYRQRRTMLVLAELDDHALKDIGIHRSEIGSVTMGLNPDRERRR